MRLTLTTLLFAAASCVHQTSVTTIISPAPPPGPNELSAVEAVLGWKLLFDGRSLNGWHGLGFKDRTVGRWIVDSGSIRRSSPGSASTSATPLPEVDLVSDSTYADFELTWEWRISEAGNSGLKYNVSESLSAAMAPVHSAKGWEYQMNDDEKNDDNKLASHRSGALYDVLPPNGRKQLNPAGQWNRSGILVRGNHAEHWLNGQMILSFDYQTPAFDSAFAHSKYAKYPSWFPVRRAGQIVLQDHGDAVLFRNIRIRTIK